ncbi:MAG TPA: 16S rRNA (uracil(1498)-N(3))-methyltransferase [Nitrolancea sp.]|nr:16S rRNA (uracil(1498)-N(3))-methyltransferase [Nitrolancea sp.]
MSRHGHRFFLQRPFEVGDTVSLPGQQSRQIANVLRLAPGDVIELFNGDGYAYPATIVELRRSEVDVKIERRVAGIPIPAPPLHLALALIKQDRFEFALQKVTELGVERLIPIRTERTVISFSVDRALARQQRWQRIAEEAAEQSGRSSVPLIEPVSSLPELLAEQTDRRVVILWEDEHAIDLVRLLDDKNPLLLVVGPEGGFSSAEIDLARQSGERTASLGPLTLRAETAAMAAAAVVLAHNVSHSISNMNI